MKLFPKGLCLHHIPTSCQHTHMGSVQCLVQVVALQWPETVELQRVQTVKHTLMSIIINVSRGLAQQTHWS